MRAHLAEAVCSMPSVGQGKAVNMASSEPVAAVLGHPETLDDEAAFLGASTSLTNSENTNTSLDGQSGVPEADSDVEELLGILPADRFNVRSIIDFLARMGSHLTRDHPGGSCPEPLWGLLPGHCRMHGDYYHLSQVTTRVAAFWSHSWAWFYAQEDLHGVLFVQRHSSRFFQHGGSHFLLRGFRTWNSSGRQGQQLVVLECW